MDTTSMTTPRRIFEIAEDIRRDWGSKVNFAAKPYLEAMDSIQCIDDRYGMEDASMVVAYFLCNAGSWRGEKAREIKTELKAMLKA